MKCFGSFGLFCLVTFLACGQGHHKSVPVLQYDSLRVSSYESKSVFYQNKMPDSAVYFADKGLRLSRSLYYTFGEGLMLNRLARINEQYDNLKLAVKYQKEALTIFTGLKNIAATAHAAASLGSLEGRLGNFTLAIQLISSALTNYEKTKDTAGIIDASSKLGDISELSGDLNKALQYYARVEQLNKGMPLSDNYFALINKTGSLHAKLGNHQKALDYYEAGIGNSGKPIDARTKINFLNNAGKTSNSLGDKQKALAYHQQGLQEARKFGLDEEEARSLIGIASTLESQDADLSVKHLKNALAISDSIGQTLLSAEIYHSLSDIYRQQSRYLDALIALEKHHRLLDSLTNENKGHKIAVLQSSYELTETKLRIETLELANQAKTYQRNVLLLAGSAVLVILLILAGYYYKTNRLNKKLETSNLVKDKLFSIIGHDLRNPIGGITQLLTIMEQKNLSEEKRLQMASLMKKQGDAALHILNALLSWGESQLKGVHIKPSDFDVKDIINKNIAALNKHAADKLITLTDHTPDELSIFGDANHFDFIMRNLISNAIKFSHPSGKIEIVADNSDPGQVIFSVKDHGLGISKAQQENFLKSNLEVSFGTSGEKGTGIGLMLSKEFVKANHGRIWIESQEGNGTTFYFTFSKK